jgi:hypothetical protein
VGWFCVTVLLPIGAPIAFMFLYRFLPLPKRNRAMTKLILPIKDGQLCWIGMALCASALYEIDGWSHPNGQMAALLYGYKGWASAGFGILLVACSIMAAGGAVFTTPVRRQAGVPWAEHYGVLIITALFTAVAAGCYTVVHFQIVSA